MTIVNVPWENQNGSWWNQTCADIIEHFGLPGGRYITEVNTECMKFHFESEQDALMCKLLVSEKI